MTNRMVCPTCLFDFPARRIDTSNAGVVWSWPQEWRDDTVPGVAVRGRKRHGWKTVISGSRVSTGRSLSVTEAECPRCRTRVPVDI